MEDVREAAGRILRSARERPGTDGAQTLECYGRSIEGADEQLADYHGIPVHRDDVLLRPIDTTGLHAPSRRSALRGAERDPLTAAFCSAMDDVVAASCAALWILLWRPGPDV